MAATARVEIRLDPEEKKRLHEVAEHRHASVSDVVRELIGVAYEELALQRRLAAVERLIALGDSEDAEVMPDPQELKRQIVSRDIEPLPGFYSHGPVAEDIDPVTAQTRRPDVR